ncbi:MAG: hypothetical protein MUP16_11110 [Sedimentisphaerales bacterium]|nr:hypothetical protein [Sedimentisphaerales bacterium]
MNDMIEKLKDKNFVRAFGLMKPEERECFKKVGTSNCIFYNPGGNWFTIRTDMDFDRDRTYAIKSDYQPEPPKSEPEDIEITQQGNWLGIVRPWGVDYSRIPHDFTHLGDLTSHPKFEGFYLKGKDTEVDLENVARYMPNVIARFRA